MIKRNAVVALAGSLKRKKALAARLAVGGAVFSILLYLYFKLVAVVEEADFWGQVVFSFPDQTLAWPKTL